jgi:hypothetical protein
MNGRLHMAVEASTGVNGTDSRDAIHDLILSIRLRADEAVGSAVLKVPAMPRLCYNYFTTQKGSFKMQ